VVSALLRFVDSFSRSRGMQPDVERATERSHLLPNGINDRRMSAVQQDNETRSILSSHVSKAEQALAATPVGERLPYNDYTTIDWLHDLAGLPLLSCCDSAYSY
jgi:hypothetical protein